MSCLWKSIGIFASLAALVSMPGCDSKIPVGKSAGKSPYDYPLDIAVWRDGGTTVVQYKGGAQKGGEDLFWSYSRNPEWNNRLFTDALFKTGKSKSLSRAEAERAFTRIEAGLKKFYGEQEYARIREDRERLAASSKEEIIRSFTDRKLGNEFSTVYFWDFEDSVREVLKFD